MDGENEKEIWLGTAQWPAVFVENDLRIVWKKAHILIDNPLGLVKSCFQSSFDTSQWLSCLDSQGKFLVPVECLNACLACEKRWFKSSYAR